MTQALSRYGIGGSEAATALGLNPYQRPIELWQRKRAELAGQPDPFPVEVNEPIRWGILLEQPIRQAYCDRFGVEVATPTASMFHPEHPWRRATPDGFVIDRAPVARIAHGVEIKTASHRLAHVWGPDGTDEVPEHYAIQCHWSMHVLDVHRWDLAALIGGADFRCYRIERDRELEATMVERVAEFWERNVLGGVEPDDDGSNAFRSYLIGKWRPEPVTIKATPEVESVVARIAYHRGARAGAAKALRQLEGELRAAMGPAEALDSTHGVIWSRERAGRRLIDWKAIAMALAGAAPISPALLDEHTKRAKPCRPIRYPAAWTTDDDDDRDE